MALLTTILAVVGILTGGAFLLWMTAAVESRQLGPRAVEVPLAVPDAVVDTAQAA